MPERGRANPAREAERRVVGGGERLVVVPGAQERHHRAEDLLARDAHLVVHVLEDRRLDVEAVLRGRLALAAGHQAGTLLLADRDVVEVGLELGRVDGRADLGRLVEGVSDHQRRRPREEGVAKPAVDARRDDHAARRRTALAGRVERPLDRALDRVVEVGVVENDQRVLAPHLELDLLHPGDCPGRERAAGLDGPREADRVDLRGVDNRVADLPAAADDQVEDPGRASAVGQQLGHRVGTARHQRGRLEDDAVGVGERGRDLPGRDRDREVPGRDDADHPEGFSLHRHRHALPRRIDEFARDPERLPGVELEDVAGAHGLTHGLLQGLALLAGQQAPDLLGPGEDPAADRVEQVGALLDARPRPGGEGGPGGLDGPARLGGVARRVRPDDVVDVGRVPVHDRGGGRLDPCSVDVVPVCAHRDPPGMRAIRAWWR